MTECWPSVAAGPVAVTECWPSVAAGPVAVTECWLSVAVPQAAVLFRSVAGSIVIAVTSYHQ